MKAAGRVNRGPAAAAANRAAILYAAREAYSEHGPAVPMSLVARAAGVSNGVLYRHFPTRDALTRAVFDEDVRALEARASRPGCTLEELLTAVIDSLVDSTAFVAALRPGDSGDLHAEALDRINALLAQALASDTSGFLRSDVTNTQVVLALALIAALLTRTPGPLRRSVANESWLLLRRGLS